MPASTSWNAIPTAARLEVSAQADQIADALVAPGWIALPGWIEDTLRQALQDQLRERLQQGRLAPARIGRGAGLTQARELRSDQIQWLDAERDGAPVAEFLQRMHALREALNQRLYLGLADYECHYAHYPPGARYDRHLDRFRSDDARAVSTVLYLNQHWQADAGGELRIHASKDGAVIDIAPEPGLLLVFDSARIEHEVLPTRVDRYSIAGWMRRRELGPAGLWT